MEMKASDLPTGSIEPNAALLESRVSAPVPDCKPAFVEAVSSPSSPLPTHVTSAKAYAKRHWLAVFENQFDPK